MSITTKLETVTPAKAKRWFEECNYECNRDLNEKKVDLIVRQILQGLWQVNGDTIRFDVDGKIIDGQHRLAAIAKSGKPVKTLVTRGLPTEAFTTIDRGWKRSTAAVLKMCGYKYAAALSSAGRIYWNWERSGFKIQPRMEEVVPDELIEVLDKHSGLQDAIAKVYSFKAHKFLPGGLAAFCYYLFSQVDEAKTAVFFERLGSGYTPSPRSATHILREKLINLKLEKKSLNQRELFSMIARAWNAHYHGKGMKQLRLIVKGRVGDKNREVQVPKIAGLKSA